MQLISTDPRKPGVFAIGQEAVGLVAVGQLALGVVAIGQVARGIFCVGQGAVGVFAVGQGAIGLVHGTGMIALAGNSGYGIALHLLPRIVTEPPPELPPAVSVDDLTSRSVSEGWIAAELVRGEGREPRLVVKGNARIEQSQVRERLLSALDRGDDQAHVSVRADVVVDDSSYRSTETHTDLVAHDVITYRSRRPRHLAYPKPPKGAAGERASPLALVVRTAIWLVAVGLVWLISFWPLAAAFLGVAGPFD